MNGHATYEGQSEADIKDAKKTVWGVDKLMTVKTTSIQILGGIKKEWSSMMERWIGLL